MEHVGAYQEILNTLFWNGGGATLEFEFALSTLPRVTCGREFEHTRCFVGCWLARHLQGS